MSSLESEEADGKQSVEFPVKSRPTAVHTYDSVKSPPVPKRTISISNKSGGYVIPVRRFAGQEDQNQHYLNVTRNKRARNLRIGEGAAQESSPYAKHLVESQGDSLAGTNLRTPARPQGEVNDNSPHPQRRSEFDPPTTMGNLQDNMLQSRMKFAIPTPSLRKPNNSTTETNADFHSTRSPKPTPRFKREQKPEPSRIPRPPRQITVPFSPAVQHPTSRSLTTGFLRDLETGDPVLRDIFQQCEATMERYAKQVSDGRLIFTSDCFACGLFDHHGGYLPLPFHKVSLYVTPHAIVGDYKEPIFVYVLPESAQEILVFEDGEEVISSTIVCGKTGHKFSSDVVLSFPLSTQLGGLDHSVDQQVIVWEYGLSTDDKPKQQVLEKMIDCFYSIKDNRCTLMVSQLANFTVISKAEKRAEDFRSCYPSPSPDESVSLRVGVFGRQIAGTGSAQIRVIFWKDSDLETKRIVAEEQQDGFTKLDRVRVIVINRYRKTVWVAVINVIPGWSLLSKDKENFTVEHILLQNRKDGRFPSCTFALYRSGGPGANYTPHVAACTIEVSQEGGDEDGDNEDDTIQLVALVDEGSSTVQQAAFAPDAPSVPPRTYPKDLVNLTGLQEGPSPGKGRKAPVKSFPVTPIAKPPACLRYKTLAELALHLQVSDISGRCWKLLAKNMRLSAPDICCLSERYLCPGEALINWYLGQQVAIVAPREALRRLLDLFREMKWPELQAIMVKELRITENQNQGLTASSHLKTYEIIDDDNHSQSPGRRVTQKVDVHTPYKCSNLGENRKEVLLQEKSFIPKPRQSAKQAARGDDEKDEQKGWKGPTQVQRDHQDRLSSKQDYDFKSQRSGKALSPTASPKGFSYEMPQSKLWRSMQNVSSSVKESTLEEPEGSKCPEVPDVVVTDVTSQDITLDEESPYLQPDRKKVKIITHHKQPSKSVRLKKNREITKTPIPPKRSSSFMTKQEKGANPQNITVQDTSLVDSESQSKSLISLKDMSTKKQNEHNKTYNTCEEQTSLAAIPLLQPHQDYTAPGNLQRQTNSDLEDNCADESTKEVVRQDAQSLIQTKIKNLHKVVKRNLKKKNEDVPDRPPRRHSLSLDDSKNESIYDNIDGCSNQMKDLTMADMTEASGERQYGERLKQLSKDLLAKITPSTASKKPLKLKFEGVDANDNAVGLADKGAGTRSNRSSEARCSTDDMISYEDIEATSMNQVGTCSAATSSPNKSTPKGAKPGIITNDMECYEDIMMSQKQVVPAADPIKLVRKKDLPKLPRQILPGAQADDMVSYENTSTPQHPVYRTGTDQLKPVHKVKKRPFIPPRSSSTEQAVVDDMVGYEDVTIPEYPLGTTSTKFKHVSKMAIVPQIPTQKNTDYRMPTDDMVTYDEVSTEYHLDGARIDKLKLVSTQDLQKIYKKPQTSQRAVTDEMTTYEDITEPEFHVGTGTDQFKPVGKRHLPAIPPRACDNPRTAIAYNMDNFDTSQPTTRIEHSKLVPKTHSPVIPSRCHNTSRAATDDMVNYEDIGIPWPAHPIGKTKDQKLPTIPPRDQKRPFAEHHTTTKTDQFKPFPRKNSPVVPPRDIERSHAATDDMVSYEDITMSQRHVEDEKHFKPASKKKVPVIPPREHAKPPAATYDSVWSGDVSVPECPNEARINQLKANSREKALRTPPPDHTHGTPCITDDNMQRYEDMKRIRGPARTGSDLHSKPQVAEDNMPGYEEMTVPQYPAGTGSDDRIKMVKTHTGKLMPVRVFVPPKKLNSSNY